MNEATTYNLERKTDNPSQLAVSESKASCVMSLFVPKNENNVTSLVKLPLSTNQDVVVYTFKKYYPGCITFSNGKLEYESDALVTC